MRLICPNCAAQYEVDDAVIPADGRDVQCSNCGHSWFQPGKFSGDAPPETPDEAPPPEEPATPETDDDYDLIRALTADPEIGAAASASKEDAPQQSRTERRPADPSVLNVLREEAEREARARRAEGIAPPLEEQTELALGGAAELLESPGAIAGSAALAALAGGRSVQAEPAPEVVADLHGVDDTAADRGARKGLLPDIEEINSTLSAASGRSSAFPDLDAAEVARRKRSGFRMGFSAAFTVAILFLSTYVLAPTIAAKVPALEAPLSAYVAQVDALRLWIDDKMKSSTDALRNTP